MVEGIGNSILDLVGNTPMVRLDRYFKGVECTILGKCDFMNPAGSVKDRIGFAMIQAAENDGHIKPGGTIVEATAGNTGVGLCIAAVVMGYNVVCCTPDKMSQEKIDLMRAFGARVVVTPTVADDDPSGYTAVAKRIAAETPNAFYIGQFQNQANPDAHYATTGPELWEQTGGEIDVFVVSAGTGGTVAGAARYLKEQKSEVRIVLGDPAGSIYAANVPAATVPEDPRTYKVEGIGNDYLPRTADFKDVDLAYVISDRESFIAARRLARTEGLFCGGSSGCNLAATMHYIREHSPPAGTTVVVFLPDTGERYLSKIFNDDWMRENQYLGEGVGKTAEELVFDKQANAPALISATPDTPVTEIFKQIKSLDISQVPVVDDGTMVGAVTEEQILDLLLAGKDLATFHVRDVMGDPLRSVDPASTAPEMLEVMHKAGQDAVIVKQGDGFDILTKYDLLRAL